LLKSLIVSGITETYLLTFGELLTMKGVSGIIAAILLVTITISLVGRVCVLLRDD